MHSDHATDSLIARFDQKSNRKWALSGTKRLCQLILQSGCQLKPKALIANGSQIDKRGQSNEGCPSLGLILGARDAESLR